MITDSATDFFESLAARNHEPLLGSLTGTIQFDLKDGARTEHWHVRINRGDISVGHDDVPADAVVEIDKGDFVAMTEGRINAVAAFLRGELVLEGDVGLVISFQRLFPGPPNDRRSA